MLSRVAVVSLARATDRRKHVKEQAKLVGVPYEVVDAVDGASLCVTELKELGLVTRDDWHDRDFLPGEVACTFSHKKIWSSVQPGEFVLILEDDLVLTPDFNERMLEVDTQARMSGVRPDLLVMHSHQVVREGRLKISKDLWRSEYEYGGTAAYAINYRAASRLMEMSKVIDTMTDGFLNRVSREVETYTVIPFIGDIKFGSIIGPADSVRTFRS